MTKLNPHFVLFKINKAMSRNLKKLLNFKSYQQQQDHRY